MTITYDATERCKQEAPAVVHVDGTARPQIVRREINPDYYDILTEYNRLTGHPSSSTRASTCTRSPLFARPPRRLLLSLKAISTVWPSDLSLPTTRTALAAELSRRVSTFSQVKLTAYLFTDARRGVRFPR